MKTLLRLFFELLWLAGAAAFAWYFPITFAVIEIIGAATTFALWRVERSWA